MMNQKISMNCESRRSNRGFTLIETLVSLGLGVLVAAILGMTIVQGFSSMKRTQQKERLHSHALVFTESLQYWIKRGSDLVVSELGTKLEVSLPDSSIKIIEKVGDDILIDGTSLTPSDIKISELKFIKVSHSIRVAFTFVSEDSENSLSATTTVSQRNIP